MDNTETLIGLVKQYSPSGQERPAVDWLVARMATLGFTRAFRDEAGNAIGVMGHGPRQVVLLGHIDTVPGEIPIRVETVDEAGATRESPLLYGRGSVDAKGPLACFTDAVAGVGAVEGWQFVVIGAVEEERDSDGARHVAAVYHPQFTIIGEPNHWDRVALGYKGSAWVNIRVNRTLAHTAARQESACEAAVTVWQTLQAWAESFNTGRVRAFEQLLLTLRGMESGGDGFDEWARLRVGARLPLDLSPSEWYARVDELASGEQVERIGFALPAFQCEKNTPLVRAFLTVIRAAGGSPSFVYKTGTADLNVVAPAWGCPALVYGPGDSTLDHTPDEHISLNEYGKAVTVLKAGLKALVSG
ncbi:MAG: [LysW]-lysine hydrolase [Anaerolineales bacterium]